MTTDNLFLSLHRWAHRQDENFKTEALAYLLRLALEKEPELAETLLQELTGLDWSRPIAAGAVRVDSQYHTGESGVPDVRISSPEHLVLVEVKVFSGLGRGQFDAYEEYLRKDERRPQDKRLVLLTLYAVPEAVVGRGRAVRWHQLATVIENALKQVRSPEVRFLAHEFVAFLGQQGMTLAAPRAPVSQGVRAYLERAGDDSLFGSRRIRSLRSIAEEPELQDLHNLLSLIRDALRKELPEASIRLDSGGTLGGWIGYNIDQMQFFCYLRLDKPDVLLFELFDAPLDSEKARGGPGFVETRWGRERWYDELDLASEKVRFFDKGKKEQQKILGSFIRKSYRTARSLA